MPVNGNALNDDCLLAIFKRIPLGQLLRLNQVSPRWAKLLPLACARRRTLVLILGGGLDQFPGVIPYNDHLKMPKGGGEPYYDLPLVEKEAAISVQNLLLKSSNYSFDDFLVNGHEESEGFFDMLYRPDGPNSTEKDARRSGQLVNYLADLLPNVNTLVVIHSKCIEAELHSLVGLLGSWSLVTLKLWIRTRAIDKRYVEDFDEHPVGTLLRSINRQRSSLRQLTLDIGANGRPGWLARRYQFGFPDESFAFIAHLKVAKLYLHYYDSHLSIWENVHRYDSAQLGQIAIGTVYDLEYALRPQFEFVTTKVRELYWYDWYGTVRQLGQMCSRFTSLTKLQLDWSPPFVTFTELVANLSSLRQLNHLKMCIDFEHRRHPENPFALVDRVEADGEPEEEPRPISLPQVKILELWIRKRDHRDFESFSSSVFPSLETIILKNIQFLRVGMPLPLGLREVDCAICRPNITGEHDTQVAKRCHQLMARSLRNKFANPSVRLFADGAIVKPDCDSGELQDGRHSYCDLCWSAISA